MQVYKPFIFHVEKQEIFKLGPLSSNQNWNITVALTTLADNDLTNWFDIKRFTKLHCRD